MFRAEAENRLNTKTVKLIGSEKKNGKISQTRFLLTKIFKLPRKQ